MWLLQHNLVHLSIYTCIKCLFHHYHHHHHIDLEFFVALIMKKKCQFLNNFSRHLLMLSPSSKVKRYQLGVDIKFKFQYLIAFIISMSRRRLHSHRCAFIRYFFWLLIAISVQCLYMTLDYITILQFLICTNSKHQCQIMNIKMCFINRFQYKE